MYRMQQHLQIPTRLYFDTDTTVNLNGTKELTGKTLTDSAFYFIVDPQETASGVHASYRRKCCIES